MGMDDLLDFEEEDLLLATPRAATKRRKVIDLDELLGDFCMRNKLVNSKSRQSKASEGYSSDEDDKEIRENEITFCNFVDNCQKQVSEIDSEDHAQAWGQKVFGRQKFPLLLERTGLENSELFQSCIENEMTSVLGLNIEQGMRETFLEGLLTNGWLSKLVLHSGFVEDCIASWTFYKMLYASNEVVQASACDFWCGILLSRNKVGQPLVKLAWLPNYSMLKVALVNYGYLYDMLISNTSSAQDFCSVSECERPPKNISSWLRVMSACCRFRDVRCIFSTSEAEELLIGVIWLFLDRHLQGLTIILSECLQSVIYLFSESEWDGSCMKVSKGIACRVPRDLNCLRVVECITGSDNRCKHLRSQLALQFLVICFQTKAKNAEAALTSLMLVNIKDKDCNFFKLYIHLVLAENLLLSCSLFKEKSVVVDSWCKYLRNCSSQIACTDLRSYASKVRNKASYLLQNMILKTSRE